MLKSWSIQNFKAIVDSGVLQLEPVTVLAGLNSSGKTSLLQSILMIAQTLSNPVLDRALLPNGPIVQLGTFEDILHRSSLTQTLTVGFELFGEKEEVAFDEDDEPFAIPGPHVQSITATIRFHGASQNGSRPSAIEAAHVSVEHASFHLTAWDEIGFPSQIIGRPRTALQFTLQEVDEERVAQFLKEGTSEKLQRFAYRRPHPRHLGDFEVPGASAVDSYILSLVHFLPSHLASRLPRVEQRLRYLSTELSCLLDADPDGQTTYPEPLFQTRPASLEQGRKTIHQFFEQNHLSPTFSGKTFPELMSWYQSLRNSLPEEQFHAFREKVSTLVLQSILDESIRSEMEGERRQNGLGLQDLVDLTIHTQEELLLRATDQVLGFFTRKIRYLGPLRADPQTAQKYPLSSEFDDVGFKGEYAAAVYEANQERNIAWYNPFAQQVEQSTLRDALDSWARYLHVAQRVSIEMAGSSGFRWQVCPKEGQPHLPLAAVGIGVSQVLPILVMGLVSSPNTLLITEQPELHLHPRMQARLGDFFLGLSACQKQCLIETHSENLVNQLRYHIVRSGGQEKSNCAIYFVQQNEQGAATFEPIEISARGNILNWPDGFFDETFLQQDRITEESLKQRAKQVERDEHSS